MAMTISTLRANLYRVVDQVIETGIPVEIIRNGRTVRIVAEAKTSKLARLKQRPVLRCKPEELLGLDWSSTWTGDDLP